MQTTELKIFAPVSIELDWPTREEIVADILEPYQKYGVKSFALCAPSAAWRAVGYPPREHFIEKANLFREVKEALSSYDIELGWWITATLKSGPSDDFVSIVKRDGTTHPFASCPLDPNFRKRFAEDVALFASIAKPAYMITEDDYSLTATDGCFCENHLNEFAKRQGRYYSREELLEIFGQRTKKSYELLRAWRALSKDTLASFAEAVRNEVDKESPEIPIGYGQPGDCDFDGDATEAVSRAFAGKNHTPFSRLYGASYCGVDVKKIPEALYHALYTRQHIKENFKFYHETDGYPHSKFYTAGKHLKTMMSTVYSYNFDGSLFYMQQLLDDPNEEPMYGTMLKEERARFNAVHRVADRCELKGVEISYDPFWNTADSSCTTRNPLWMRSIPRFGIPHTTLSSKVAFWDVRQAKYADHETVMDRLKKGLFLDGDAAKALCERGYGKYLGVEIGEDPVAGTNITYDLGSREVICEKFAHSGKGKNMPCAHMYAPPGNGRWLKMTVTDPKCEVVTKSYTFQKELITPTMTKFLNELGGKVVVMSLTLDGNNSQALFNYRRLRLMQELLVWCGDEYVLAKNAPDVFVITNEAKDKNSDFLGMLTVTNLCEDTLEKVEFHLPPHLKDFKEMKILAKSGEWEKASFEKTEEGAIVHTDYRYCDAVYILIS